MTSEKVCSPNSCMVHLTWALLAAVSVSLEGTSVGQKHTRVGRACSTHLFCQWLASDALLHQDGVGNGAHAFPWSPAGWQVGKTGAPGRNGRQHTHSVLVGVLIVASKVASVPHFIHRVRSREATVVESSVAQLVHVKGPHTDGRETEQEAAACLYPWAHVHCAASPNTPMTVGSGTRPSNAPRAEHVWQVIEALFGGHLTCHSQC